MILSIVLEYMDIKTLERMSVINSKIQSAYKNRVNTTVYTDKLIHKSEVISNIASPLNEKKHIIKAYTVFNTFNHDSILILCNEGNMLLLYDLKANQFQLEYKDVFTNKEEHAASVQYYNNNKYKIDYVLLCSNKKSVIIYQYCDGFKLKFIKEIASLNNHSDRQCFNMSIYPFQIDQYDVFAMINSKLDIVAFDQSKPLLSKSIQFKSINVKGFLSIKDNQQYLYTYSCQGIASYTLKKQKENKYALGCYKTYISWNKKTSFVQYFYSEKNNEDYLLESNTGSLIIWEVHNGKSNMKIQISLVDDIFSIAKWNNTFIYLTTFSRKLYQVNINEMKSVPTSIVFKDIVFISSVIILQPSLVSLSSDGSFEILTYDI